MLGTIPNEREEDRVRGGEGRRRRRARASEGVCEQRKEVVEEGCYERCVQLTVASSVHAVPLAMGIVNARGITTYLRQFLFMADPLPEGGHGSFSLIGIELLFSFINDARQPEPNDLRYCYDIRGRKVHVAKPRG